MKEGQQRQAVADATAEAVRVADAAACAQEHAHTVALVELKKVHTAKLADLKEAARAQEAKLTTELAEAAKAATKASVERENALSQVRSEMSCLGISTQQAQTEQAKAEQANAEADVAHEKAAAGAAAALATARTDVKDLRESLSTMQADFQSEQKRATGAMLELERERERGATASDRRPP